MIWYTENAGVLLAAEPSPTRYAPAGVEAPYYCPWFLGSMLSEVVAAESLHDLTPCADRLSRSTGFVQAEPFRASYEGRLYHRLRSERRGCTRPMHDRGRTRYLN